MDKNNKTNWTIIEEISAKRNEKGEIKRTVKAQCKCGYIKESLYDNVRESKQCSKCAMEEIKANTVKDETKDRLRIVYRNMKSRCNNPNCKSYKDYGARGIKVEESFNTFQKFYDWATTNGYKIDSGLEIDRIDVYGNYSIDNCRWVTKAENNRNRRDTKLTKELVEEIRYGKYKDTNLSDLEKELGINRSTLSSAKDFKTWV